MTELSSHLKKYRSASPLRRFLLRRFLSKTRRLFQLVPKGFLCDVGCGAGFVLRDFFDHGILEGQKVLGLDICEETLRFASTLVPQVSFQNVSVYKLPFNKKECR